jgi:hypothetical protein
MRSVLVGVLLAAVALAACESDSSSGTPGDSQVGDFQAIDLGADDQREESAPDQAAQDVGGGEAPSADVMSPDASPGCSYAVVDEKVVLCGSAYTYVLKLNLTTGPSACSASYWVVKGASGQHATPADAAAAAGCATNCIWSKAVSVTLLHCGQKTGYIQFEAPGCDPLLQFPDGYYPSFEAYETAHPCLDGGTSG